LQQRGSSQSMKTEENKQEKKPDPYWPFPQELIPFKHIVTKFNPDNHEDAPF